MSRRYWGVVPAAGIGSRMQSEIPKQYLTLGGRSVLEHSLQPLLTYPRIEKVVVALATHDERWPTLGISTHADIVTAPGGGERCDSVRNALEVLRDVADVDDWVLVHDAARPCLRCEDLDTLVRELDEDACGGLLAVPVRDTMKQADADGRVQTTLPREAMWHALTPQMFRVGALTDALDAAHRDGSLVTDEASAMEAAGSKPRLIQGHADNIKITRPEDLGLAEFFLHQQGRITT